MPEPIEPAWLGWGLAGPVAVSLGVVVAVLVWIVRSSEAAWSLLGIGRGLVPPEYYPVSGFVIILGTTLGQAVGWAAGSGIAYYVMTLLGRAPGFQTSRIAMSVVYLGLGTLPILVFHALYGAPLLGLPREGLAEWLLAGHPDAHWLLIRAHPFVDGSVVPLGLAFLGLLWLTGERPARSRLVQFGLALAVLGTSLAVALSLGIHSTIVHIKLD
jgi:hypothetical protein